MRLAVVFAHRLIKQWTNMILMNWYEFIIFFSFCFSLARPPTQSLVHCVCVCALFFFSRSWINNNLRRIDVKNKGNIYHCDFRMISLVDANPCRLQLYRIVMLPHHFWHEWKRHEKLNTQMMYGRNARTTSNPFLFRLKNKLRCADVRMKICFTRDFFFVFFCCCCLFNYYLVFSFIQHKYLLYQRNVSGPICYVFIFFSSSLTWFTSLPIYSYISKVLFSYFWFIEWFVYTSVHIQKQKGIKRQ